MHWTWLSGRRQRRAARTERKQVEQQGQQGQPRVTTASRPNVARAGQAAALARAGDSGELRATWAADRLLFTASPAGQRHEHGAADGDSLGSATAGTPRWALSPSVLRATVRVAEAEGRRLEDIWDEALREWLAREADHAGEIEARVPAPHVQQARQHTWLSIDETLRALRAS